MAEYVDLDDFLPDPKVGDTVPAEWFQAVRDNLALIFGADAGEVNAAETRSVDTYGDLATIGPAVTVETGTRALVIINAYMTASADGVAADMSFAVSGATSIGASTNWRAVQRFSTAALEDRMGTAIKLVSTLTPGLNTFTAKYRRAGSAGTATFINRRIFVLPLA